MSFDLKQAARSATACVLAIFFAVPVSFAAPAHIVSPAELQNQVRATSETRAHNLEQVKQFLSSEKAQKAITTAHMDTSQVTSAVSSLSDAELAQLASRATRAQADFAAGDINDRDLLLIILGIAALVLIIVAVR